MATDALLTQQPGEPQGVGVGDLHLHEPELRREERFSGGRVGEMDSAALVAEVGVEGQPKAAVRAVEPGHAVVADEGGGGHVLVGEVVADFPHHLPLHIAGPRGDFARFQEAFGLPPAQLGPALGDDAVHLLLQLQEHARIIGLRRPVAAQAQLFLVVGVLEGLPNHVVPLGVEVEVADVVGLAVDAELVRLHMLPEDRKQPLHGLRVHGELLFIAPEDVDGHAHSPSVSVMGLARVMGPAHCTLSAPQRA